MALAGISSPLMQFLLQSQPPLYRRPARVALNLGIEPPTQPERPTGGARERLAASSMPFPSAFMGRPAPDQPCGRAGGPARGRRS